MKNESAREPDNQQSRVASERLTSLFEFLKAYSDLRIPVIRDIAKQVASLWMKDLPDHPSVELPKFVAIEKESDEGVEESNEILLRVTRPKLKTCPPPPEELRGWLVAGWDRPDQDAEVRTSRNTTTGDDHTQIENFSDDVKRNAAFDSWKRSRDTWAANEQPTVGALKLFERLYELWGHLEREGDRLELLIGEGILRCDDADAGGFRHPVLLQRLEMEFHPEKNNPQFVIRRREHAPELCMDFLRALPNADVGQLAKCAEELRVLEVDPLGAEDTTGFLRRLVQGIFPKGGQFYESNQPRAKEWVTVERDPVIFLRQRRAGISHAIDLILQDIAKRVQSGEAFAAALMQILGVVQQSIITEDEETDVPAQGNEDEDILLSLPANREQLQIAERLRHHDTVLVQGPPGTGKTHTIANLIGNLLAQGKRVLVTAQTPKALRVLRSKIAEPLQPLCVSVLKGDKQNNEELQQSVRQMNVRLSQDSRLLEQEAVQLQQERKKLLDELRRTRRALLDAREDEIREVVFGGKGTKPIEAAKIVQDRQESDSWIPGPVTLGESLPLTYADAVFLYQTNALISQTDEKELSGKRLETKTLPTPTAFAALVEEEQGLDAMDLAFGAQFWSKEERANDLAEFGELVSSAKRAIDFFKGSAPWKMEAVQAGRDGAVSQKTWLDLISLIEKTWDDIQQVDALIMAHGPAIADPRSIYETRAVVNEIVEHVESGRALGFFTRITKRHWHDFLDTVCINGRAIDVSSKEQLLAAQASIKVAVLREELCERWERQMVRGGAPSVAKLGDKPEQVCRQFVASIRTCLEWHQVSWLSLEANLQKLGFEWMLYFDTTSPEVGENAQLLRLREAILGDFGKILECRAGALRCYKLQESFNAWSRQIPEETDKDAIAVKRLRRCFGDKDFHGYSEMFAELDRLRCLEDGLLRRNQLLKILSTSAPSWGSAIQMRVAGHGGAQIPGNPDRGWEWRQLHDELERRALVSLEDLQRKIEELSGDLLDVTARLVEKQTWLYQSKNVGTDEKRALSAYATFQSKKNKSGKGKKDAMIYNAARQEMNVAKGAVPVWIMPLNEVIDIFDPSSTRFDVVIIDEASQCDPLAMFALYLGKQAVVVGDDEQVTPLSVGVEVDDIFKLVRTFLENIPHKELYDGETSIYQFANIAFGGVIRLVEHFRCAPDIISFSNNLCYQGEIKPLREETSISLHPHVVPYRVEGVIAEDGRTNLVEAQTVASLICAAIKQPEYRGKSFGVVCLLGDHQAAKIEEILHAKLSPEIYQGRQILCGNPAHFQGDERDVMFLSMVDCPTGGPLNLRDAESQKRMFKKRYNVAASRARDQMWLVYSLNHETDLKPGDIRRRLIEHVLDPKAWQRELEKNITKAESPFEERVMERLISRGYRVQPQYRVGAYRIDMVVSGSGKKLAIECDGERWHGTDKLQEDMERQAILERLGWKFSRIRGSVFFRDSDRAMEAVFRSLDGLGILPERQDPIIPDVQSSELVERVSRCAAELRQEWCL